MAGKSYGDRHARDNAFGLSIVGGPILEFTELDIPGVEVKTFMTDDGEEHSAGEESAQDAPFVRYTNDPAQNAYMDTWLEDVLAANPTAKRSANYYKFGPGREIVEVHFIPKIMLKGKRPSKGARGTPAASTETGSFSVFGVRKVK